MVRHILGMCLYSKFLSCTLPFIKKGVELPGLLGGSYIIHTYTEHPQMTPRLWKLYPRRKIQRRAHTLLCVTNNYCIAQMSV